MSFWEAGRVENLSGLEIEPGDCNGFGPETAETEVFAVVVSV